MTEQHEPFSIQIELVEGCTLACSFCGINAIRAKPGGYKFMERDTIERIASEMRRLGWKARIEFAMHGEPSVHPELLSMVRAVRNRLPKASLMMTSNGTGFLKHGLVQDIFDAGLNVLALDDYEGVKIVGRVLERLPKTCVVRYYPEDRGASIHKKRKPTDHEVVVMKDLLVSVDGNHSRLSNHAGQAFAPSNVKNGQRCAFPFRELSVRWDGNVSLCCDDFRGVFKIANVNEMPLDALWQHERFEAARKKLYHGQRDFKPCMGCTAVSYRVGLLPDPTGQETLPTATLKDARVLRAAIAGSPFSPVVKREWE